MIRLLIAALLATIIVPAPAEAGIVMRLYAKRFSYILWDREIPIPNYTDTPHAFASFSGQKADGTIVNETWGFAPAPTGSGGVWEWAVGVVTGTPGDVTGNDHYLADGTPYIEVPVSDSKFSELSTIKDKWNSAGSDYYAINRNCINFVNTLAGAAGLQTPMEGIFLDPTYYYNRLSSLNPSMAYKPTYTQADLESLTRGAGMRGAASYANSVAQAGYGHAVDNQWLTAEYYRRARDQKLQSRRQSERESVAGRYSSQNYRAAVDQAQKNSSEAAAVQRGIDDFENTIRAGATPTSGGTWTSGGGWGSGSPGGGSSTGSGSGVPAQTPPAGSCYFIECMSTTVPQPQHFNYRLNSRLGLNRVNAIGVRETTQPDPATGGTMLAFTMGNVAAPISSRQVIHLGNLLPGEKRSVTVRVSLVGAERGLFAVFSSGNTSFKVRPATDMPANVFLLGRGYVGEDLQIEVSVPNKPPAPGEASAADRVTIAQNGVIVGEIYLTYDLYPAIRTAGTMHTGRLASGFGEDWGPDYVLCSGPPPLNFTIESITRELHNLTMPEHERACDKGWTRCEPYQGQTGDGQCVKFQAQGHEKHDKPFDKDVGISGIDFEASMTVTYQLARPEARWVAASEIDTGS